MIRRATLSDVAEIAHIHVDSWKNIYRGIIPDSYLSGLSYDESEMKWKDRIVSESREPSFQYTLVAEDEIEQQIVGFASGGKTRSNNSDYDGELYSIYIQQDFRGKRIGKKLVDALVEKLIKEDYHSMIVWVLAKNPYKGFYKKLGGEYVRSQEAMIGTSSFEEVSYGWKDLNVFKTQRKQITN